MKSFNEKFHKVLKNEPDNYILPFLWVHNEDDELIKREIKKIYESGVHALCIESRPHEKFGGDDWWSDIQLIFDECEKYGMEAWLLDDKHYPTGFAIDKAAAPENAHLAKRQFSELDTDVLGPVKNHCLIIDTSLPEDAEIIKIVAYKKKAEKREYYGEYIDLTDKYRDGLLVDVTLPEGIWTVFTLFHYPYLEDEHLDTMNPEAVDILINAVYEPMYQHFSKYFGNTFRGFFSDEPYIMHYAFLPEKEKPKVRENMPYNHLLMEKLLEKDADAALKLPSILYHIDGISPDFRVKYMDAATKLYAEHFCKRLGDWSRAHGVEYIGHIIEDNSCDTTFHSGGHFFRSMDGQDMAGIDVVLNEIMPGFEDSEVSISHGDKLADNEFFHYELAKLASSHSHIQKDMKKGRAMCEMYGAYGWAEGLKMMKWLSDHMLVRGINYFVPHAFSGIAPDYDCPPHFYEGGTYSQFKDFKALMEYSNRVSTILTDGSHKCKVAILYRAENEWAGGEIGHEKKCAKILTDNQIDFDIVSADYIVNANLGDGVFALGDEEYPCIIVPKSEYLPKKSAEALNRLASVGVTVVFAGGCPEKYCENEEKIVFTDACEVDYDKLAEFLRNKGFFDITLSTPHKNLRYYRYINGKNEIYMFVNEDIKKTCHTKVRLDGFAGGEYIRYDAMNNVAVKETGEEIPLVLEPYNSVFIILGEVDTEVENFRELSVCERFEIPADYEVSLAEGSEDYTFRPFLHITELCNINALPGMDRFAGHIKYETDFDLMSSDFEKFELNIEEAGETVNVSVNGKAARVRIVPPYKFDITDLVKEGNNHLEITVTTHMGYRERDYFSRFMVLEPTGLSGKVEIVKYK